MLDRVGNTTKYATGNYKCPNSSLYDEYQLRQNLKNNEDF